MSRPILGKFNPTAVSLNMNFHVRRSPCGGRRPDASVEVVANHCIKRTINLLPPGHPL